MKKEAGRYIYSPSDLIVFMESEFASWMNRYYLDFPDQIKPDETDEMYVLLQAKGNEYEKDYLKSLYDEGKDVCEIKKDGNAYSATIDAMRAGREVIYQAALKHGDFAGYADFLIKVDGKSNFGDYQYEVWDTKLARKAKPYFLIQLCCYAEMLEFIQGKKPSQVGVVLGNKELKQFRTEDYFYFYLQLKQGFLNQQLLFNANNQPEPTGMEDYGRWTSYAEKLLEERDHLSRVANIRSTQINKLKQVGIITMTGLAETNLGHVPDLAPTTFKSLKQQARLQIKSQGKPKPEYELIPQNPEDPRRGLAILPPYSPMDICFDMEGYPLIEGGLEYLFGVTHLENGQLQFKDWWAHNRQEEKQAFEDFIAWVMERFAKDPSMHIYHYASYEASAIRKLSGRQDSEVSAIRKLAGRNGTCENEVDTLLRNQVFVDLYTVVRQALRVGEPKYSIKNIEHIYMDARAGKVATAVDSVIHYQDWLESQDGNDWKTSKILADIRAYNKEDCDSTWKLNEWLRELQKAHGPAYIPKEAYSDEDDDADNEKKQKRKHQRNETGKLALELLADLLKIPEDKQSLQELFAYLLEFHWREARPIFWAKYDRHAMTEEQLVDDIDCLGGLERTDRPAESIDRSTLYEYRYDPAQDTKLDKDSKCFFAHDLYIKCTIVDIDTSQGIVSIKLGPSAPHPAPENLSLIPDEYIRADVIAESIYNTVVKWKNTGKLPHAIEDFLLHRRPKIKGNDKGSIIPDNIDFLSGVIKAIENLDESTICIQGPPGSGKTYTSAQVIIKLLQNGKRIGISSNSHKAIAHLMDKIAEAAEVAQVNLNAAKIQGDKKDFHVESKNIKPVTTAKKAFDGDYQLIGGTAWAFSNQCAIDTLDYLFVDEAGQVSVANLVGMAPSTKNIVLIGDQMQLSQPIKGSHPGESGFSTLQYLLKDKQTIPDDFGIFLSTTWRMHPNLCDFISRAVYEDRLQPKQHTKGHVIVLSGNSKFITKTSGILYIPVEHEGNTQGSVEEAEVVRQLVNELLDYSFQDNKNGGNRKLNLDDTLIVAPYNLQVRTLKDILPTANIGSVDKFQGQERPVVIVSMCSSSGDASPRGIEFLFSKNRLNVAVSRAKSLAIIVGHPTLARTACNSVEKMQLVNLFCRIVESGQ